ncbi:MAG TPA: ATPase, T2SS/T4P/T4SS family [Candidatus Binatia bacterium]|nr:ATPase, T2SS/T4P/T4SS family [Candidatus Binatia bacterium]
MQPVLAARTKIGALLAKEGLLTAEQLVQSLDIQKKQYPALPLGKVCIALGYLSPEDLTRVLSKHHRRIPLGELLVHLGVISMDQLTEILELQQRHRPRKKLGRMIVEKGLIDESTLIRVLYEQAHSTHGLDKRRLGKFGPLVVAGYLTDSELDAAVKRAQLQQLPVEKILTERYRLTKQELGAALGAFYGCPFVEYDLTRIPPREHVQQISPVYLKANHWIPLQVSDHSVTVLIDDPQAPAKIQDIRRLFPGKTLDLLVGMQDDIAKYIARAYEQPQPVSNRESVDSLVGQLSAHDSPEVSQLGEEQLIHENDSAVVRLVNRIIMEACKQGVSDIHIEPAGSDNETIIRFRIDGHCYDYLTVPAGYRRALVSRIKIMARLDIAERRKPQDGKITFKQSGRSFELRVATIPTAGLNNEDVVMRLLATEKPKPLEQLNMTARNLREFQTLLRKPYGLILCVGPTGSGKTTTLHSALTLINTRDRKIWTAEDPVEITQPGLRQVQVQPKIGFDFAAAMRAFLRADPDVIMVGEIRDKETAEIVVEASLTGHLVLSTLHTNSAAETVTRLLDMGIDPFNFADSLLGVLAQRLARTLCNDCKEPYDPTEQEFHALEHAYGPAELARAGVKYNKDFRLYRGRGCASCRSTGYKGRIALHELLIITDEMRRLIHGKATAATLLHAALQDGMTTLLQDGVLKAVQGWTDYNQVKAVAMR